MKLIDKISVPKRNPLICTICGEAGRGKTSLAATFPKPVFIRTEDGLDSIPEKDRPPAFPLVSTVDDLWDQLKELYHEEHDFKTLVIDSVTTLERLFIAHIMENDAKHPKSIRQALGGYGNGIDALLAMHQRVRKAAGVLAEEKGMNIVFVAHADTELVEPPDQEPYSRYSLRMNRKSMAPYIDEVGLVGLLRLKTYVKREDDAMRGKAISDGTLYMVCTTASNNITKNRYGITEDLPFKPGVNPLAPYLMPESVEERETPKPARMDRIEKLPGKSEAKSA